MSRRRGMTVSDFRRIALSFEGAEEGAHMHAADFRVGGRIFATLASEHLGLGNLKLSRTLQDTFLSEHPDVFLPIPGGWGRMGMTHVKLATADEALLTEALRAAWQLRVEMNGATKRARPRQPARRTRT